MNVEQLLSKGCFIAVDKPRGPPSAQVGTWVRNMLGVKKSGHIGTLDPNVSGVLIIALGKAVRLSKFLSKQDKEYVGIMHLHADVNESKIRKVVSNFVGDIYQKPPLRSAVAKRVRKRRIYEIKILDIVGRDVLMYVRCEAGTYIRKLMYDIGKKIGCGANMTELRRIKSGSVGEDDAHNLYDIKDAVWLWKEKKDGNALSRMLIPPDKLLDLPVLVVKDTVMKSMAKGSPIYRRGVLQYPDASRGDFVKVYSESGVFCGTALVMDGPELYAKIDVNWLS